jgi:hypothetical protein
MTVFNYIIRLYNQDVSVGAAPLAAESATESTTDRRGFSSTVNNRMKRLSSSRVSTLMKRKNWLEHRQKLPLINDSQGRIRRG